MENTNDSAARHDLDPEISRTLRQNPEAAHFIATLAAGTDLRRAVMDHFGSLFSPPAETAGAADTAPLPEPAAEAAAPVPAADLSDTPMYRPLGDIPDAGDDSSDDDFFTFPAASVWD